MPCIASQDGLFLAKSKWLYRRYDDCIREAVFIPSVAGWTFVIQDARWSMKLTAMGLPSPFGCWKLQSQVSPEAVVLKEATQYPNPKQPTNLTMKVRQWRDGCNVNKIFRVTWLGSFNTILLEVPAGDGKKVRLRKNIDARVCLNGSWYGVVGFLVLRHGYFVVFLCTGKSMMNSL
ncbi:uncharacterized protein DS421_14g451760 [Arachis hypogaea]|nr:uncharacterized protein DS421_14g451760 [Arachis hypogaea]